jgi:hypothetical protein
VGATGVDQLLAGERSREHNAITDHRRESDYARQRAGQQHGLGKRSPFDPNLANNSASVTTQIYGNKK